MRPKKALTLNSTNNWKNTKVQLNLISEKMASLLIQLNFQRETYKTGLAS